MTASSRSTDVRAALPADELAARLSALVDGEDDGLGDALQAWREDARARATWHRYQLIGDVLRSEELAGAPGRDAAFLARLRDRLQAEPVPLAPTPSTALVSATHWPRRRQTWITSAAIAAGFVAVAGVLVVTRTAPTDDPGSGAWLARLVAPASTAGDVVPASATMLRNAGLDRYLEAHRGALGGAVTLPGAGLRQAGAVVTLPQARPLQSPAAGSSSQAAGR